MCERYYTLSIGDIRRQPQPTSRPHTDVRALVSDVHGGASAAEATDGRERPAEDCHDGAPQAAHGRFLEN